MTSITIYDGANTIGGTKIFIEEKGKGIFLDFGILEHITCDDRYSKSHVKRDL